MNPALMSTDRDDWRTPAHVFQALDSEFKFTLDGAAYPDGRDALLPRWCSDVEREDWRGERVYCNPPYGNAIRAFADRAPDADVAVLLLPARPDTRTWHEAIFPVADEIRFVRGRLRFEGADTSAPFPSCVAIWHGSRRGGACTLGTMDFRQRRT